MIRTSNEFQNRKTDERARRARRSRLFVNAAALLALALLALGVGPAAGQSGQDNFSDITHPDPSEVAASVVSQAVQTGQIDPQSPDFQAQVQAVVDAAVETGGGGMSEGAVRQQLGNVATSILVRAGILSFEGSGSGPPEAEEPPES